MSDTLKHPSAPQARERDPDATSSSPTANGELIVAIHPALLEAAAPDMPAPAGTGAGAGAGAGSGDAATESESDSDSAEGRGEELLARVLGIEGPRARLPSDRRYRTRRATLAAGGVIEVNAALLAQCRELAL